MSHAALPGFKGEDVNAHAPAHADLNVPNHWEDASWKNDACASFRCGPFRIWIDYADEDLREGCGSGRRFAVERDGVPILSTDDWGELLEIVE